MDKKLKTSLLIGSIVCLVVLVIWYLGGFSSLQHVWSDFKFKIRGPLEKDTNIVIVAVDENSIAKLGRWPWPRRTHARLIDILVKKGVASIVFDVLFTEHDKGSPDSDSALIASVRKSQRTVLGGFFQMAEGRPAHFLLPIGQKLGSPSVGFVNIFPEMDGVCRRIPVALDFEDTTIPSLSLAALSIYYKKDFSKILEERGVVLDANGEMIINYRGGFEMFDYISYYDVLTGRVPNEKIKGKIALIGGTAAGLFDFKAVPFAPVFPGVEVHANAMSNIINGNFLKPISGFYAFLLVILFCGMSGYFLAKLSAWQGSIFSGVLFFGYLFLSYLLFKFNYSFDFLAPAVAALLCYLAIIVYRFFAEEREKIYIKKTFGHYLSPHVMEDILRDPARLKLGGEKQFLTVLFSDIRGFTTMSEKLKPEEVVGLLNEYLTEMVKVVFKHDGTLDKFIGDAVMAFWGAPIPQNDHPIKAVNCAVDMIKALRTLQEKWKSEGKELIDVGIGINTGDMVVGNMGSMERMDYTVIGDNVNLASRLEGLNKEYNSKIIISDSTYDAVKDFVETKFLGEVKVKGKAKAVKIYSVIVRE